MDSLEDILKGVETTQLSASVDKALADRYQAAAENLGKARSELVRAVLKNSIGVVEDLVEKKNAAQREDEPASA